MNNSYLVTATLKSSQRVLTGAHAGKYKFSFKGSERFSDKQTISYEAIGLQSCFEVINEKEIESMYLKVIKK